MDLYAYSQIESLGDIMKENGIDVPRLRGLRLMRDEETLSKERIDNIARRIGLTNCEFLICRYFSWNDWGTEFSHTTSRLCNRYLYKNPDGEWSGVRWENIHGKKRKHLKYELRQAKKRVEQNCEVFNKYCGRDDILYIHARIGGLNWPDYRDDVEHQPWFIEKVDDPFDSTYCDIYARIQPVSKTCLSNLDK